MANTSRIQGLRPINQPFGSIRATWYEAATGVAFYRHQPVDLDSDGRVVVATVNSGNYILGSVLALGDDEYGPPRDSTSGYIGAFPASANSAGLINVLVADDPSQWFVIEEDTGGSALDAQDVGIGANFTYIATTGNTKTGVCNAVLDRSTAVAGSSQQFRLIKKWDKIDNDYGDYCKWIVMPFYHRYNPPISEASLTNLQ